MQRFLTRHRWVVLACSITVQCLTNFVAVWAVYQPYVAAEYGYTSDAATLVMSTCNLFFGVLSIAGGRVQDRVSPRFAAVVGVLGVTLSFFNAWWIPGGKPLFMYAGFCLFFGGGCGFLNQATTATLLKYYPDRKGFATGFSSAASAVYIIVLTYLSEAMIGRLGVRLSLLAMGGVTLVVGLGCALLLVAPPEPCIAEKSALAPVPAHTGAGGSVDFTPAQVLRTPQYYLLIGSVILALPAFQLINPQLVSLCMARGLDKELALSATAIASAATAVGRFTVPTLSDRFGRRRTMAAMWAATALCLAAFMTVSGPAMVGSWAALSLVYSGGYVMLGAFTNDLFGFRNSGSNIGLTNLSNTIGSLLGPVLLTALTPAFGGNTVYYIGIGGTLLATGCVLLIRTDMAREKARLEARTAC